MGVYFADTGSTRCTIKRSQKVEHVRSDKNNGVRSSSSCLCDASRRSFPSKRKRLKTNTTHGKNKYDVHPSRILTVCRDHKRLQARCIPIHLKTKKELAFFLLARHLYTKASVPDRTARCMQPGIHTHA